MFGNLKKKLNSALQGGLVITDSLQQQYRQRRSTPTTPISPIFPSSFSESIASSRISLTAVDNNVPPHLNLAAGENLLGKYEEDWKDIHNANEENGQKAEIIATHIEKITKRTTAQHTNMTALIACLSEIPEMVAKLEAGLNALHAITELSAEVEKQLEHLEDLCEECDLQEYMLQKQFESSQRKQQKMNELEIYRQKVAAGHQEKIQKHEEYLRQIQRERQAVFDDAFRGDMEEFKQKGVLPKIGGERKPSAPLEAVVLEDKETKDALEEFLNG